MCVAVPLKVIRVEAEWAVLEIGSGELRARTDLVDVHEGDYALVHAGFIIDKIDPENAVKTLALFERLTRTAPR